MQTDPLQELQTLHAEEDAVLNSYGWVDRKAGVVRIPVQRAIELLAQRGLPARQSSWRRAMKARLGLGRFSVPLRSGDEARLRGSLTSDAVSVTSRRRS